ncbi:hypothetical protein AWB73_06326 [Caballeronia turbans]|jgi:hypothetical protein|nr:hypothetical protein AWB73_06326 [Caballeronia turbans]
MFAMPNGAYPGGMCGSTKPPSVVTLMYSPFAPPLGPKTSIRPERKLVAKRNRPFELTPKTRPL